ncbi:MAG: acetyltransferase [Clostridiaceae bacterium]|jgi:GNAT superfamily N-acetyltransferase|nr:acetyltransferase [Clostridiaceae bacterium]
MNVEIIKAKFQDLQLLYDMQIESFKPLLEKYKDYDMSPGNETIEQIIRKYNQVCTTYWLIKRHNKTVGGVRVVSKGNGCYRVSPIFILPLEQGKGIAQETFMLLEEFYQDSTKWELDTILEEKGNCYLYEKLGYRKTGKVELIKDGMTIVYYEKRI